MRWPGLCGLSLALPLALGGLAGCGGGVETGMATKVDQAPLDPGGDEMPNMSGPSTAPPKKRTPKKP